MIPDEKMAEELPAPVFEESCEEKYCIGEDIEDWFEFELIPMLPENAMVITDNASGRMKSKIY